MRKSDFCICENKEADQLCGKREADQHLCFRYTDRTVPLLSPKFQASSHLCGCTARIVSDLVGNPEDRFSHNEAQITQGRQYRKLNENEQQNKPQKSYRLGNDGNKLLGGLLAHLSRRLIGQLVGYPWSSVRPSSSIGVVHNAQTSFSPKLLGQSKPDCM